MNFQRLLDVFLRQCQTEKRSFLVQFKTIKTCRILFESRAIMNYFDNKCTQTKGTDYRGVPKFLRGNNSLKILQSVFNVEQLF